MKELLKRSLTGSVFVILMITMIWWNIWSLSILLLFILITGMTEFLNLTGFQRQPQLKLLLILFSVLIFSVTLISRLEWLSSGFILYVALFSIFFSVLILKVKTDFSPEKIKSALTVFVYIVLPVSLTLFITSFRTDGYNPDILLLLFVLIWTYDSFAYLTGILLGKHKILPSVSPKKSWEGLFGGLAFTLLAAFLISKHSNTLESLHWMGIAVIVVITGTTGDFYESYLKRKAGVKDSGNLLPGHGGILDRFDSYLFICPVVYLYLYLIQ